MKSCTKIINEKGDSNCQRHPTNLLAKQPKFTTPKLHALMTLNYHVTCTQTALRVHENSCMVLIPLMNFYFVFYFTFFPKFQL